MILPMDGESGTTIIEKLLSNSPEGAAVSTVFLVSLTVGIGSEEGLGAIGPSRDTCCIQVVGFCEEFGGSIGGSVGGSTCSFPSKIMSSPSAFQWNS